MGSVRDRSVRLLASILICGIATAVAVAANAQQEAITATVMGEKVQKVGYRAMIQKQAIMYNLAGYARNNPDGTVGVELQGDEGRITKTLEAVSAGNKKSSQANIIGEAPAAFDPNLKTFTILSWTSTSRNILNGLVTLRDQDRDEVPSGKFSSRRDCLAPRGHRRGAEHAVRSS